MADNTNLLKALKACDDAMCRTIEIIDSISRKLTDSEREKLREVGIACASAHNHIEEYISQKH